jgi:hypothetical protein
MAISIPPSTRRTLLAVATSALHELLKDETILNHSVVEAAMMELIWASDQMEVEK